jgi:hypothetical protein
MPYQPGYEGWEVFDSLPREVRDAHNIVWTGYPRYSNQYRTSHLMRRVSPEDARAIVELDGGKHMLAADDVGL